MGVTGGRGSVRAVSSSQPRIDTDLHGFRPNLVLNISIRENPFLSVAQVLLCDRCSLLIRLIDQAGNHSGPKLQLIAGAIG
jgi:hypothetical protein